jgi:hypothetical protein
MTRDELELLAQKAILEKHVNGNGWIGAWPGNSSLQTRQSLSSQVTSQIVRPEINVTFRYNPKKVRRA